MFMARIIKLKNETNFFVNCEEKNNLKKLKQKIKKLSKNHITPAILEQSPYKIHISLEPEEYKKYRKEIINIINQYIFKSALFEYKYVRNKKLKNHIEESKELLDLALTYENNLKNNLENKINDATWEIKLIDRLKNHFKIDDLPDMEEIITILNLSIKTDQRFIDSDQFTLYIPENFNKYKIVSLCLRINDYLLKNKVKPGKIFDVESPIGHYLNFRQEFLLEDYNEINKTGIMNLKRRIDTIPLSDDEIEKERRKRVISEQENSKLYRYIKNRFETSYSYRFFQPKKITQIPIKEKNQSTISHINLSNQKR
jgi:hypothetical protein